MNEQYPHEIDADGYVRGLPRTPAVPAKPSRFANAPHDLLVKLAEANDKAHANSISYAARARKVGQ